MLYEGSCHCGNVAFTVEGEIKEAMACNCTMCQRKGALMWFTPYSKVNLKTPEDAMATYQFNKHHINHKFCKTCGIHALADGLDGKGSKMAMINIRAGEFRHRVVADQALRWAVGISGAR
jgi:hypothetical protein